MKKKNEKITYVFQIIFFMGILLTSSNLSAQSLLDKIGGIPTQFVITTNSIPIEVENQVLFQKDMTNHKYVYNLRGNIDEVFHGNKKSVFYLEFIASDKISNGMDKPNKKKNIAVRVYDQDNNELNLTSSIDYRPLYKIATMNVSDNYVYTIDFEDAPLLLLSKVNRIDIEGVTQ